MHRIFFSCRVRPALQLLLLALILPVTLPAIAHACACGCGVFDVGTPASLPAQAGGSISLEYDFMNQSANWSGASSAPAIDNDDRQIRTNFVTASAQYLFGRKWGAMIQVPYWDRRFLTADDGGEVLSFTHGAIGDIRIRGVYTGLSADLSTGLTAGLKLPTGDYRYANFDRDTEIGSGSTDAILGAYHVGRLGASQRLTWFVDGQSELPFAYSGDYRPGAEVDASASLSYGAPHLGVARITPVLGLVGSARGRDAGSQADPDDSGYDRLLLAPGVQVGVAGLHTALTVSVPLYEHVNGNQLVAPALVKLVVGRGF